MASSVAKDPALAKDAIGLREVLFQSVTHMAPAAAVAFSIPAGAAYAARALPLSTLLALIACLFVAVSIGELAKHLPSAGGFYTYTSKALHPGVGFLVAWAYAGAEALIASFLFLNFSFVIADTLNSEFGWTKNTWWIWVLASSLIVLALGYFGVRVSTRAGTIMGAFEIVVFGLIAIWLIAKAGNANTLSVFTTHLSNVKGYAGMSGIIAAGVYSVLAFTGFESAAPLAEEARDPRRTIRSAVILSCLCIGIFYVFTTYAASVSPISGNMSTFSALGNGDPWTFLARAVWGVGWVVALVAICNSCLANANAGSNATTRTWFAMGRIRLLPEIMSAVHPRWKSPHFAVFAQFVVAVGLALWLGFQYGAYTAWLFMATLFTLILIVIYVLIMLSCIVYYWRFQRQDANIFLHGIIPVLGIAAFVPAFLAAGGLRVFSFISKLTYPSSLAGLVDGIWLLIGVAYLVYLHYKHPERLAQTGRIFGDEVPSEPVGSTSS
ncbi:MAG: APC family permease [Acidimicrobiales bacterium]|jgi:amino acid transporter